MKKKLLSLCVSLLIISQPALAQDNSERNGTEPDISQTDNPVITFIKDRLVFNGSLGYGFSLTGGDSMVFNGGAHLFPLNNYGIGFQPEVNTLGTIILPVMFTHRADPGWLFTLYNSFGIGIAMGNYAGTAYVYEGSLSFELSPSMDFYIGPKASLTGQARNAQGERTGPQGSIFPGLVLGIQTGLRFK